MRGYYLLLLLLLVSRQSPSENSGYSRLCAAASPNIEARLWEPRFPSSRSATRVTRSTRQHQDPQPGVLRQCSRNGMLLKTYGRQNNFLDHTQPVRSPFPASGTRRADVLMRRFRPINRAWLQDFLKFSPRSVLLGVSRAMILG